MASIISLVSVFPLLALAQSPTETLPIIINQGPTSRCYGWYAGPDGVGYPPQVENATCAGPNMYGRFTIGPYDYKYPSEFNTTPGYFASVNGPDNSPLTILLSNNARNTDCGRGPEVSLSYDYPGSALYSNISSVDLSRYDSIIIEYDVYIKSATPKSDCSCQRDGSPQCPSWWKTQLHTDILFYEGTSDKNFNVISVRNFDPQNQAFAAWNTTDGYRVQFSDNQIPPQPGSRAHVKVDAKHLMAQYSNQLCQGGGIQSPVYMRAIQFVTKCTGADMTVEISNVKANAFKYAPGQFTESPVSPGPTPTYCPTTSGTTSSTGPDGPTVTAYGQCGGSGWSGATACASGSSCQTQNQYYAQCLPTSQQSQAQPVTKTSTSSAPAPAATKFGQCGGKDWQGPTTCPEGTTCQVQNEYYSQCL